MLSNLPNNVREFTLLKVTKLAWSQRKVLYYPEHIIKDPYLAKYTNNKIDLLHCQFISFRNIFPKNLINEPLMSFDKIYDFTNNFILHLL